MTVGKQAIAWYIGSQGLESSYGAATSVVVLLIWVYTRHRSCSLAVKSRTPTRGEEPPIRARPHLQFPPRATSFSKPPCRFTATMAQMLALFTVGKKATAAKLFAQAHSGTKGRRAPFGSDSRRKQQQ